MTLPSTATRNMQRHPHLANGVDRHPRAGALQPRAEPEEEGRRDEALAHYQQALADSPDAHYALGFELDADGIIGSHRALQEYIRLKPEDST